MNTEVSDSIIKSIEKPVKFYEYPRYFSSYEYTHVVKEAVEYGYFDEDKFKDNSTLHLKEGLGIEDIPNNILLWFLPKGGININREESIKLYKEVKIYKKQREELIKKDLLIQELTRLLIVAKTQIPSATDDTNVEPDDLDQS